MAGTVARVADFEANLCGPRTFLASGTLETDLTDQGRAFFPLLPSFLLIGILVITSNRIWPLSLHLSAVSSTFFAILFMNESS